MILIKSGSNIIGTLNSIYKIFKSENKINLTYNLLLSKTALIKMIFPKMINIRIIKILALKCTFYFFNVRMP